MRKRELKRRLEELEANESRLKEANAQMDKLAAYVITGKTVYVSAPEAYIGAAAVIDKLLQIDPSPTHLVVDAQYIPAGADGEPSYYAASGTASI